MRNAQATARRAFTLVELLVVMGLILVLASLAVLIIPTISSEQRATQGATQLQQWLEGAKQRALRDRAPRGLRLLPGSTFRQVTDVQYLEQAPDYHLGVAKATIGGRQTTFYSRAKTTGSTRVTFDMFDPTNPTVLGASAPPIPLAVDDPLGVGADFPVQPGDSIELGGQVYRITSVGRRDATNPAGQLILATAPPAQATINYRIIRKARPVGDEPMTLPQNIIIDLTQRGLGYDLNFDSTTGAYDIMFAPDGRVIGMYAGLDKVILWVRDATVADNLNDPTLVVIYPRTGQITAHPVDLSNYGTPQWQPYSFTNIGRRSSI